MTEDWTELAIPSGVDLDQPGIFAWIVDGCVLYVGRASPLRNRWKEYERNVWRLRNGEPYRKDPSGSFRQIHVALGEAFGRRPAVFVVLEVCSAGEVDLNDRKRHWIAKMRPMLDQGASD